MCLAESATFALCPKPYYQGEIIFLRNIPSILKILETFITVTIEMLANIIFSSGSPVWTGVIISLLLYGITRALRLLLTASELWSKPQSAKNEALSILKHGSYPLGFSAIVPFQGLPLSQKPDWPRYWKPGKFQMTMALRKLDINNWFNYDELFDSEHAKKLAMARSEDSKDHVDYLDGIDDAVSELLDTVVAYVTKRYPCMFRADKNYVYIDHLQEKYRIRAPFDFHPLTVVGLLVMDDVYVLKKGHDDFYTL